MENKKTIFELEQERFRWSLDTFPKCTPNGSIEKLREELKEIEKNIENKERDPIEFADCLMCLFDIAARLENPISVQEIFDAFEEKLEINKKRIWKHNPDNSYSHIK